MTVCVFRRVSQWIWQNANFIFYMWWRKGWKWNWHSNFTKWWGIHVPCLAWCEGSLEWTGDLIIWWAKDWNLFSPSVFQGDHEGSIRKQALLLKLLQFLFCGNVQYLLEVHNKFQFFPTYFCLLKFHLR